MAGQFPIGVEVRTLGSFPLALVDPSDCDFPLSWTGDDLAIMSYHFEDGRVMAHTTGIAFCQRHPRKTPDTYIADFVFDVASERSPYPR